MPTERHFLDWSKPALPQAARWLADRYATRHELNLAGVIVVLPGRRAIRRLLELLVAEAETRGVPLVPPELLTESNLPERLYVAKRPFASDLTQQLAWTRALRETPSAARRHFLPVPPADSDSPRWLELGQMLKCLHTELAADGVDFREVVRAGSKVEGFAEADRWNALADVQQRYLRLLDDLELWDVQTARLVAIQQKELRTDTDIVLAGMVDLHRTQRQMLAQVADRVHALVFAPAKLAERFDEFGCLVSEQWASAELPLADEQIERVDGPADQAEAVGRWLGSLGGKFRTDEIAIGCPDERLAPHLQRELAQCGVPSRWAALKRLRDSAPYRLLELAASCTERRRFQDLAALVRHPDVLDWLELEGWLRDVDPLTLLDRVAIDRVPAILDAESLRGDKDRIETHKLLAKIEELLNCLNAKPRPLSEWSERFRELLRRVYARRVLDRSRLDDHVVCEALRQIHEAFAEVEHIPKSLLPDLPAREGFRLLLSPQADEPIAPATDSGEVEILGWLELPLDDSQATIVTSLNEGLVPSSIGTHPFLPNTMRRALGVLDNDRRYARDAYALSLLLHSRSQLRVLVAHRDTEGNPLTPSRLLFAADEETVVRRARESFRPLTNRPKRRLLLARDKRPLRVSALEIPQPKPLAKPIERLSVTSFRSYLACPYRFYLRHVLQLEELTDEASELDPAAFGNLLHDVLQHFGRDPEAKEIRQSVKSEAIFEYLGDRLSKLAAARYGKYPRPAIKVQVELARSRLSALAAWQAERTQNGWQIVHSEDEQKQLRVPWDVDGKPIELYGRIDRVDYHPETGTLCIFDYKTADSGPSPGDVHVRRKTKEWVDLQLPLYRHLVRSLKLPTKRIDNERVQLGYVLLCKDTRHIGASLAQWTPEELSGADEIARQVVRSIRKQGFWPMAEEPPAFCEDLAVICQDHRLGRWCAPSEGEAA